MSAKPRPPETPPPRHLRKRVIPKPSAGPPPPWKRAVPCPPPPPPPPPARSRLQKRRVHQLRGCGYDSAVRPAQKRRNDGGAGQSGHGGDVGKKRIKGEQRSSALQPDYSCEAAKKRSKCEQPNSAEQPAHSSHVHRKYTKSEQPDNHHLFGAVGNKRIKCEQPDRTLLTSVAYLYLPEIPDQNSTESEERSCAIEGLQQALEVGADIINMIFQRASDIDLIWVDLCGEMQANAQHPELQCRRLHQMLTIFSPTCCGPTIWDDPFDEYEKLTGVPTMCLTFPAPSGSGNMVIFNSACPRLSQSARRRMLDAYSDEALDQIDSIRLIGGELHFLPY